MEIIREKSTEVDNLLSKLYGMKKEVKWTVTEETEDWISLETENGEEVIISEKYPYEEELGLDYGTLPECLEVIELNGVKLNVVCL